MIVESVKNKTDNSEHWSSLTIQYAMLCFASITLYSQFSQFVEPFIPLYFAPKTSLLTFSLVSVLLNSPLILSYSYFYCCMIHYLIGKKDYAKTFVYLSIVFGTSSTNPEMTQYLIEKTQLTQLEFYLRVFNMSLACFMVQAIYTETDKVQIRSLFFGTAIMNLLRHFCTTWPHLS